MKPGYSLKHVLENMEINNIVFVYYVLLSLSPVLSPAQFHLPLKKKNPTMQCCFYIKRPSEPHPCCSGHSRAVLGSIQGTMWCNTLWYYSGIGYMQDMNLNSYMITLTPAISFIFAFIHQPYHNTMNTEVKSCCSAYEINIMIQINISRVGKTPNYCIFFVVFVPVYSVLT